MAQDFDLLDTRRQESKGALHAYPMGTDPADGKRGAASATTKAYHNALEYLDALAIPLDDAIVYADSVSGPKWRDIRIRLRPRQRTQKVNHVATTFR